MPNQKFFTEEYVDPDFELARIKEAQKLKAIEARGDGIGSVHSADIAPWHSFSNEPPGTPPRRVPLLDAVGQLVYPESSEDEIDECSEPSDEMKELHVEAIRRVGVWRECIMDDPDHMPKCWHDPVPSQEPRM